MAAKDFYVSTDEVTNLGVVARFKDAVGAYAQRVLHVLLHIVSEPLTHFLVAGCALFAAGHFYQEATSDNRIVVTSQHVAQLANEYAMQFGTAPAPLTLEALIRHDIHDEVLFRQGRALKLDQDDQIVRRRIVQKMQFLIQDLNAPAEPTDAQLQVYYRAHIGHYVSPVRVTFSHIYFSSDRGGGARARAQAVRATLSNGVVRAPDRGDPFPDLYDFSAYEPEQVFRLFGHTPFADAVFSAPVGKWEGPFRSGYGWHLIYIDAREPAKHPPLSAVRDTVRTDYLQTAQDQANKQAFDTLANRFTIVREDRKSAP